MKFLILTDLNYEYDREILLKKYNCKLEKTENNKELSMTYCSEYYGFVEIKDLAQLIDLNDQEKDAIEELRKAREQARKDIANSKELSNLQVGIQRAMMDTSGASDVALLKAQQDLEDKLTDMAEDKYSQMLDDIIDSLEEEKDALQKDFDEMFTELSWL